MKVELQFTVDANDGKPCITFTHHENDSSIEQKLLKVFIDGIRLNGLKLKNPNGGIKDGNGYENYVLAIK